MKQKTTPPTTAETVEFSRAADLAKTLGVSINTIWRLAKAHDKTQFPRPIKLSDKVTVWRVRDVLDWVASKEAA